MQLARRELLSIQTKVPFLAPFSLCISLCPDSLSFLWLCNKYGTNTSLVAQNNRNLFLMVLEASNLKLASLSQNQGVSRSTLPPEASGEHAFLASSSSWWLLASRGLWPHPSSLRFREQAALSSVCVKSPSASLTRVQATAFRAHLDNPG